MLTTCALVFGTTSPPAARARVDTTVRVSADRVLGWFDNPAWYQNQSGPNSPLGPRNLDLVEALDVHVARVWALPRGYYDPETHRYDFDFAGSEGTSTYRYLDQVSGYARRLLLNLGECAPDLLLLDDPAECRRVLHDGLIAYKRRYPSIRYVELFNEPDKTWPVPDGHWEGLTVHDYYEWYRIGYSVVNEVNRDLHPRIPLRIGGPAAASFDGAFLRGFLDRYARDPDPARRLDFISYHQYRHAADPAAVGTEKQTVREWLTARRLDPDTPVFVTEYGVFPGAAGGRSLSEDRLIQAAAMQTLAYYYVNSDMDAAMHWVFSHPSNPRKSMFVRGVDGRVHPYFNLVRMQSRMKSRRVAATSDGLSTAGLGVNVMATADGSGVAVLTTNYQWVTGHATRAVSMDVDLPAGLAHRRLRLDRYLIDSTTSNDAHDPASSGLQRVERRTVSAGATVETTFRLEPNALSLVVLTPATG
ncbi:MAG: GH39 family glycosyl hydrolase [Mycobacteriales bacterium]